MTSISSLNILIYILYSYTEHKLNILKRAAGSASSVVESLPELRPIRAVNTQG